MAQMDGQVFYMDAQQRGEAALDGAVRIPNGDSSE